MPSLQPSSPSKIFRRNLVHWFPFFFWLFAYHRCMHSLCMFSPLWVNFLKMLIILGILRGPTQQLCFSLSWLILLWQILFKIKNILCIYCLIYWAFEDNFWQLLGCQNMLPLVWMMLSIKVRKDGFLYCYMSAGR